MKVLDVNSLESGLKETQKILKSQKEQAEAIHKSIIELIGMNHLFAGKGADAILDFYNECHLPFLQFFKAFTDYYIEAVTKMDEDLDELEPNNNGFIAQSFLENDVNQGLEKIKSFTNELTNEANGYITEVSDILSIPPLSDESFNSVVQKGQRKMKKTIEKLNDFDENNMTVLEVLKEDAQTLQNYINKIELMFKLGDISIADFKSGQLDGNSEYSKVKSDVIRETFSDITNPFGKINESLSWADAAFISANSLSLIGASALAHKMDFKYIGGKPSFRQLLKGDYRFSVRAPDSWTSRGNYNSRLASFYKTFVTSSPTNPLVKFFHKHAASYRTPSDFIKHMAGFPKNMNGIMRGSDLQSHYFNRIKTGSKELIQTAAKAKGLTTVAKKIPVAGTLISIVSNTGEVFDQKNKNKTLMEKLGRGFAGLTADGVAVVGGAKGGAVVGAMIGGPPGALIGGAIGAAGGAILSSVAGERIKDIGEITFGGLEKGFKSIGKWFK